MGMMRQGSATSEENGQSLGLTGQETFDLTGLTAPGAKTVNVTATPPGGGTPLRFEVRLRIDTPKEHEYFQHGGILQYVLRQLVTARAA